MRKTSRRNIVIKRPRKSKATNGAANRRKGHNYERKLAQEFRDLGFSRCLTSRQASRLYDDSKIDLYGVPINVQAKAVKDHINYGDLFNEIKEIIAKNLPERLDMITAIFHKRRGTEVVVLPKEDFYRLISKGL